MTMKPETRISNSEGRTGLAHAALFGFRHSDFFPPSAVRRPRAHVSSQLLSAVKHGWIYCLLRRTRRISAFGLRLFALALVAGCSVGPNYKRPHATTIPPTYTGA